METPWDSEIKVCSNGPGHMTRMAAMPIYGKNVNKSSSPEAKDRWRWNLVCSIGCSSTTKFIQMMTLGWPIPILRQGQIWSLMLLYGKQVKQWIFLRNYSSRKLLRIKVTPDLHLIYSEIGGNLGLVLKMKNIACLSILLTKHVKYTYLFLFKFVLYSTVAFKANL